MKNVWVFWALFIAIILLFAGCAAPIIVPAKTFDSWPNQEWAKVALEAVRAEKLTSIPITDGKLFCPKGLTERNWVHLMAGIVTYESNFKPNTTYREAFKSSNGQYVLSSGLFQISISSTQQARYGCKWSSQAELLDPVKNIQCSAKVIRALVTENKAVTNHAGTAYKGTARYFSTMRPSGKLSQIKSKLKAWCE